MFDVRAQLATLAEMFSPSRHGFDVAAETPAKAQRVALPWRALVGQAAAVWFATRLAYVGFTYFALLFSSGSRKLTGTSIWPHLLLNSWVHWDGHWYVRLALTGYFDAQSLAFFPLYPLLIHSVTLVVGPSHVVAAALLVANLGTLGAFIGIALLAANEAGDTQAAWYSLRVLAAYPLALFLTAPYTEGLFLALAVGALLCARRGAWRWAAGWALLAGFTRPTGLALVLPLLWEYGRQHDWWRRAAWSNGGWRGRLAPAALGEGALVVGAVPVAIGIYCLYCWRQTGNLLAFVDAERIYWGHLTMPFGQGLLSGIAHFFATPVWSDRQAELLVNLAPPLTIIVLSVVALRRMPFAFTLYTWGILYLALASPIISTYVSDTLTSVGRYLVVAAPIYLLLGRWSARRPWLEMLLTSGGFLIQAILALVFLRNGLIN